MPPLKKYVTWGYFSVSATCSWRPPAAAITCGSVTAGCAGANATGYGHPSSYSVIVVYRVTGSAPPRSISEKPGSHRARVSSRIRSGRKLNAITESPGRIVEARPPPPPSAR